MKKLSKNEWVAVVVSLLVVGFFFIFGHAIVSIFSKSKAEKITQNTNLMINDIVTGTGDEAVTGKKVVVHYTGRFTNGQVFDSSVDRNEPFQFLLGGGQVIKGWDEGLVGMRVGGKRILTVPPDMGYGFQDYGPIPGGSTLIFEVELLKVE